MDSRNPPVEIRFALAAAALSAILLYFGTGLNPLWPLPWLAPIPILLFAARASARYSALAAFLAFLVGGLNVLHFYRNILELPLLPVISITTIPAILFALLVLAWRRLLLRGRLWAAAFSFPLLWTAIEYLNATTSPHSTYGSIAYTQMDLLPLIQISSLAGIWGISFVLFLIPSAIGVLGSGKGSRESKMGVAATAATIFAMVLAFGAWRLHAPMAATGFARIRMLSTSAPGDVFPHEESKALDLAARYTAQFSPPSGTSTASSEPRPDIVLLPEKFAKFSSEGSAGVHVFFSEATAKQHVSALVGLDEVSNGEHKNDALLFASDGHLAAAYEKHHFIPVLEDGYAIGADYQVLNHLSGLWGIAICKDMDFPALSREYGKRGVGLLLVPAWDFRYDDWLHSRMAILRGVESGFTIARDAKQGRLSITDNRGRVLAEATESRTGFAVVDSVAPVAPETTIYVRFGDWFAWVCLVGSACIIALLFMKKRNG
ncbi:MAG TPA: nitrilase-related carbon-nitrogen hydrolase [Candidatus Dormibacteraeota bacterium]|jgi:apolipoprotein N-acyltransferase|nr:nitrilase-related carbon-nitrogen hydrolase [Candidatus Dormibacteraeota bacterium]